MESLELVSPDMFRYKKRCFPVNEKMRPKDLEQLLNFEIQPTDILLVTYPKSGTVWMQQILVQIVNCSHPKWADKATNRTQVPFLEAILADEPFQDMKDPRIFYTHLPPDMIPREVKEKQIKVVYVRRNPKDILVSLYHFSCSWVMMETPPSFDDFFKRFLNGDSKLCDSFCTQNPAFMGSWFDHIREYLEARSTLNIHYVQYEDMLKDLRGEVVKICAFLEKDLTDEDINHVVKMSTFKNMKSDPKANYKDLVETELYKSATMRKGVAGDWKNMFTVAQNEEFDQMFTEKMKNVPLACTWELAIDQQ